MVAATDRSLPMSSLEIRTKLGLSQIAWARALNVSYNTVNNWENWGKPPKGLSSEVLRGIAAALDATPASEHLELGRRIALGVGAMITFGLAGPGALASAARSIEAEIKVDGRAWVPTGDGYVTTLSDWLRRFPEPKRPLPGDGK